ncbi:MAG: tetratricopeptide repeat protein [Myxococcota bacterium]|nr:tetratricopeptide repeat protein [Myxococcota bacterium]
MRHAYEIVVWCSERDASVVAEICDAYGALSSRVRAITVEQPGPFPTATEQQGTYLIVVSSSLMKMWFTMSEWTAQFLEWHRAGGHALAIVADTSQISGGPLSTLPMLELHDCSSLTRTTSLLEFLDVPRPHEIVLEPREDYAGALAHARGVAAWRDGRPQQARAFFEEAVRLRVSLTEGDPRMAASLNALGAAELAADDTVAALSHLEAARALRAAWLGTAAPQTAASESNVGAIKLVTGELREAARLCGAAADKLFALGEPWHRHSALAAIQAAQAHERLGEMDASRALRERLGRHVTDGPAGGARNLLIN